MEPKIPISCISNINNENKKFIDSIKCCICKGIYFEPIFLKYENCFACKNCFCCKFKIDKSELNKKDYDIFYEKLDVTKLVNLYRFKYFCPICKSNDINNNTEYNYIELTNHLKNCGNQIIFRELCRCLNIIKIYLKDIETEDNKYSKLIYENNLLEREIEMEKKSLNDKKFKEFLKSQKELNSKSLDKKHNKNINKKFIGIKRKNNNKNSH